MNENPSLFGGRMKIVGRTLLLIVSAFVVSPASSFAQVRGSVQGVDGSPLSHVWVELWGDGGRRGVRMSDAAGAFHFTAVETIGARGLTASRLGFANVSVPLSESDTLIALRLAIAPLSLTALVVEPSRATCPHAEEPAARELWHRARNRYSDATAERGFSYRVMASAERQVRAHEIGWASEEKLTYRDLQRVGAPPVPTAGRYLNIDVRIAEHGYAFATGLANRPWRFPVLEGMDAHHFASPVFGARHTSSLSTAEDGELAISFCPTSRTQPWIEGIISIRPDTTFAGVHWQYGIPRAAMSRGGEVVFTPWQNGTGMPPHLLAARGYSWERDDRWSDRFSQRTMIFQAWAVSESDSMPDLPVRW